MSLENGKIEKDNKSRWGCGEGEVREKGQMKGTQTEVHGRTWWKTPDHEDANHSGVDGKPQHLPGFSPGPCP